MNGSSFLHIDQGRKDRWAPSHGRDMAVLNQSRAVEGSSASHFVPFEMCLHFNWLFRGRQKKQKEIKMAREWTHSCCLGNWADSPSLDMLCCGNEHMTEQHGAQLSRALDVQQDVHWNVPIRMDECSFQWNNVAVFVPTDGYCAARYKRVGGPTRPSSCSSR